MIDLNLYRTFYMVAKCGSLTKAAEELYISQPAVSQGIKMLEQHLGGKLFTRRSRGIELTEPGGKQLYEAISQIFEKIEKAEKDFHQVKITATGNVRICASDNVTTYSLMRYITEYHDMYPNVSLSLTNTNTRQAIDMIKDNKADIGFVNLPIEDKGVSFTGQTGKIHDVFAASNKFAHLFNVEIALDQINNFPILLFDQTTMTRQEIDKFTHDLNIVLTPEYELSSVNLMVEMAKRGMGIACVPREYIINELKSGELIELNVTPQFPVRATGVIINKSIEQSFAVSEFLKLLNKYEKVK